MSGGGKGGSQTTRVKIPEWLETAAKQNLGRADEIAQIGYVPYMGPDVAAMQPGQIAAMQNTGAAANAFGMASPDMMAGMPQAQTFAGGVQGYSSMPLYQQSLDALQAANPGQFAALNAPFIDPQTGARPAYPFAAGGAAPGAAPVPGMPGFGPQGFTWGAMPPGFGSNSSGSDAYGGGADMHMGGPSAGMGGSGTGSFGLPDPFGGGGAFTGFDAGSLPGVAGKIGGLF
jgi:hypothetical protein